MADSPIQIDDTPILADLCTLRAQSRTPAEQPVTSVVDSEIVLETSGGWDRLTLSLPPENGPIQPPDLARTLYRAGFPLFAINEVCTAADFFDWLWTKPAVLVTALRLNYLFSWLAGMGSLRVIGRYLQSLPRKRGRRAESRCLFTLGSSQIILFTYPEDLGKGLRGVDEVAHLTAPEVADLWEVAADVRQGPLGRDRKRLEELLGSDLRHEPIGLFSKTKTSLAWRSWSERRQPGMSPMIAPGAAAVTVAVDVAPGREQRVQRIWHECFSDEGCDTTPASGGAGRTAKTAFPALAYGVDDIRVPYTPLGDLDDFLERMSRFRSLALGDTGRFTTTTTLIVPELAPDDVPSTFIDSSPVREQLAAAVRQLSGRDRPATGAEGQVAEGMEDQGLLPQIRGELADLAIAANASLSDPEVGGDFCDLSQSFEQLGQAVDDFISRDVDNTEGLLDIRGFVSALTQALHERDRSLWQDGSAPGLQFHSHACGTHAALRAYEVFASSILHSATAQPASAEVGEEKHWTWRGCVVSTAGEGLFTHPGDIIAVPMQAIMRPVPNLLRIGHECGHILFDRMHAAAAGLPADQGAADPRARELLDLVLGIQDYGYPKNLALEMVSEAFTQVFEYTFFRRDLAACLGSCWRGWVESQLAWQDPASAHLRTAVFTAIHLLQQHPGTAEGLASGGKEVEKLATAASGAATEYIQGIGIPHALLSQCVAARQLSSDRLQLAYIPAVCCFLGHQRFLERVFDMRWTSDGDSQTLDAQARAILDGYVVTDPVANLVELAFRLAPGNGVLLGPVPRRAQVAALLTYSHIYDINCRVYARTKKWPTST